MSQVDPEADQIEENPQPFITSPRKTRGPASFPKPCYTIDELLEKISEHEEVSNQLLDLEVAAACTFNTITTCQVEASQAKIHQLKKQKTRIFEEKKLRWTIISGVHNALQK